MKYNLDELQCMKKSFENHSYTHTHCPSTGTDNPMGTVFQLNINILLLWSIDVSLID